MANNTITLQIVTPTEPVFSRQVDYIKIATSEGGRGILPGHENYAAVLGNSIIEILEAGERQSFSLVNGSLFFHGNRATVMADFAAPPDELESIIQQHRSQLEESYMKEVKAGADIQRAQMGLQRSLVGDATPIDPAIFDKKGGSDGK